MDRTAEELVEGMLACADQQNVTCSETLIRLIELSETQPEVVWDVIVEVTRRQPTDEVLGMLGTGPLEDLMWKHGRDFIDRVEEEARINSELRNLLSGIYRGEIDDETWTRVVKISGRERQMTR